MSDHKAIITRIGFQTDFTPEFLQKTTFHGELSLPASVNPVVENPQERNQVISQEETEVQTPSVAEENSLQISFEPPLNNKNKNSAKI